MGMTSKTTDLRLLKRLVFNSIKYRWIDAIKLFCNNNSLWQNFDAECFAILIDLLNANSRKTFIKTPH